MKKKQIALQKTDMAGLKVSIQKIGDTTTQIGCLFDIVIFTSGANLILRIANK